MCVCLHCSDAALYLVLFPTHLICMYVCIRYPPPPYELTIENKLTFLLFILSFSKPVENTWRRTPERSSDTHKLSISHSDPPAPFFLLCSILLSLLFFPINSVPLVLESWTPSSFFAILWPGRLPSLRGAATVFEGGSHSAVTNSHIFHAEACCLSFSIHLF